jgi:hypothetical protein
VGAPFVFIIRGQTTMGPGQKEVSGAAIWYNRRGNYVVRTTEMNQPLAKGGIRAIHESGGLEFEAF